jgi:hypothetical protein
MEVKFKMACSTGIETDYILPLPAAMPAMITIILAI